MKHQDLLETVFKRKYMIKKEELNCPDKYYNIMNKCLSYIPDKRPTFSSIHEMFINYFEEYSLKSSLTKPQTVIFENELELIEMTKL